jgi:hypothetical protein
LVLGKVFKFYSSITGLPLDTLVQEFATQGFVVDWIAFYQDALKGGWTVKRIFERIDATLIDVYGVEHRDVVIKNLKIEALKR